MASKYSVELMTKICEAVAEGESFSQACKANGISRKTGYQWMRDHEEFRKAHDEAREQQPDAYAEAMMEVTREAAARAEACDEPARARIILEAARQMVDVMKWRSARQAPKRWGDKVHLDHSAGEKVSFVIEGLDSGPETY